MRGSYRRRANSLYAGRHVVIELSGLLLVCRVLGTNRLRNCLAQVLFGTTRHGASNSLRSLINFVSYFVCLLFKKLFTTSKRNVLCCVLHRHYEGVLCNVAKRRRHAFSFKNGEPASVLRRGEIALNGILSFCKRGYTVVRGCTAYSACQGALAGFCQRVAPSWFGDRIKHALSQSAAQRRLQNTARGQQRAECYLTHYLARGCVRVLIDSSPIRSFLDVELCSLCRPGALFARQQVADHARLLLKTSTGS